MLNFRHLNFHLPKRHHQLKKPTSRITSGKGCPSTQHQMVLQSWDKMERLLLPPFQQQGSRMM
jgi:hypothetical protein